MNTLDIIISLFIIFGIVKGFMDGFFVSLASLVGLVAGIYGAVKFSHPTAELLSGMLDWSQEKINLAAFALTFLIIIIAIHFLGKTLTKLASFAALGIFNKLLGAVFGALKAAFILSVLILLMNKIELVNIIFGDETTEQSILYPPVEKLAPAILPAVIEEVKNEV